VNLVERRGQLRRARREQDEGDARHHQREHGDGGEGVQPDTLVPNQEVEEAVAADEPEVELDGAEAAAARLGRLGRFVAPGAGDEQQVALAQLDELLDSRGRQSQLVLLGEASLEVCDRALAVEQFEQLDARVVGADEGSLGLALDDVAGVTTARVEGRDLHGVGAARPALVLRGGLGRGGGFHVEWSTHFPKSRESAARRRRPTAPSR
jgi:hypothetical protein